MKKKYLYLIVIGIILILSGCTSTGIKRVDNPPTDILFRESGFEPAGEVTDEYVLGPADIIEVRVWGYEDLRQVVSIPPNGIPTFYPIGKVKASGLTPTELQDKLADKLSKYVKEIPSVTVTVQEYNHYRIYVLGAVNKPGLYPFKGRMTALEAIALAGNYNQDRAALRRVQVVRVTKDDPTVAQVITIDMNRVIRKGDVSQDVRLAPNDIVFVPSSVIASINAVINQIMPSVQTIFYVEELLDD